MKQLPKMLLLAPLLALAACAGTAPQAPRAAAPPDTTLGKPTTAVPATKLALPAEDVSRYQLVLPASKPLAITQAPATVVTKTAPTPTSQVNAQIEQRLRDQAFTNQNVKYAQGFRVLVYLGIERDQAMAIRREIISRYPEETDYLTFKSPVYRLYIGDYLTRLDAARGVARLRALAPRAELQATQVLLNKNP